MRWKNRPAKMSPLIGETRYRSDFLVFPKCIGDNWRWLEYATWEQKLILVHSFAPEIPPDMLFKSWRNTAWID